MQDNKEVLTAISILTNLLECTIKTEHGISSELHKVTNDKLIELIDML